MVAPTAKAVVEPIGAAPALDALHRHLGLGVRFRRARERVAAQDRVVRQRDLERQELAGLVAVERGELRRQIEHEGAGVGRLVDHRRDAERVVATGRRAQRPILQPELCYGAADVVRGLVEKRKVGAAPLHATVLPDQHKGALRHAEEVEHTVLLADHATLV